MKFVKEMNFTKDIKFPQVASESGFRLSDFRNGEMNWRLIGDIEVDKLLKQQNLEQLDGVLLHLAEAPLAAMLDTNILDSGIVKYFMLSQYAIQYLLFCRKFLDETVSNMYSVYSQSQHDVALLRKSLNESNAEILQLHKKITHIEAIREVIYPCHLCNKSFINNDSLNIHLHRKHADSKTTNAKQVSDEPTNKVNTISPERILSGQRTRENDLSLITCIKLELEMKELKERLNHAEKQIQQRATDKSHDKLISVTTQCNLIETKEEMEKDVSEHECESKIHDEAIKTENSDCTQHEEINRKTIQEIYDRLQSITLIVNEVKELREKNCNPEVDIVKGLQTNDLVTEDVVRQLTQKVDKLSEINSEKFEKAMSNIEQNCNQKLASIEQEIHNKIDAVSKTNTTKEMLSMNSNTQIPKAINFEGISNPKKEYRDTEVQTENTVESTKDIFEKENQLSLGSNSTFIRSNSPTIRNLPKIELSESGSVSETEMLDSLSETSSDLTLKKKPKKNRSSEPPRSKQVVESAKPFTRNKAKLIYNRRLGEINCHYRQEELSSKAMQKITQQLNDKRIQNKKKYPQFYATRNRIKTYVEKLCTTQDSKIQKESKIKPTEPNKIMVDEPSQGLKLNEVEKQTNDSSNIVDNQNFRERLERILASPIQRPTETFKPVPVPRKRVVFNT